MKHKLFLLISRDDGVSAIEYALIAGVVVVAIAGFLPLIGGSVSYIFEAVLGGF